MDNDQSRIQIELPMDEIKAFCQQWNITEFALFGSVLREDFGSDSDIDVLVTFASDSDLLADREKMRRELRVIFGRSVDVAYRRIIEIDPNYLLRKSILRSAQVIYAA
jgi:predicted nucleotidyltransferase